MFLCLCLLLALSQFGASQDGRSTALNNSSLNLVQCMTRDEVQAVIRAEVETVVRSEVQAIVHAVQAEVQSVKTELQEEIQPLKRQITQKHTCTAQLPKYTCKGTPGYRQIAFINMTDTSYDCPPGLNLTSYSKRTCGRAHSDYRSCSSTKFSVGGLEYSQVCGRIIGYQVGTNQAFDYYGYYRSRIALEHLYVDGVSLTHGVAGGRQHIWTFASGLSEDDSGRAAISQYCPCAATRGSAYDRRSPPFVGNDYFCESGLNTPWNDIYGHQGVFFPDDPLWDGEGCTSTSTCCQLNNPPWFTKSLPNPTTDDIELRLCFNGRREDTPLELIELYVK